MKIRTSYSGPTETRGARLIARGAGRQLTVPYPYERNDGHRFAAGALVAKLGLEGELIMVPSNGDGFTFELRAATEES